MTTPVGSPPPSATTGNPDDPPPPYALWADGTEPWNWGRCSREMAVQHLTPQQVGTFLVRASNTEDGAFTVSFVSKPEVVTHIRVVKGAEGWTSGTGDTHPTLSSSVQAKLAAALKQTVGEGAYHLSPLIDRRLVG
eukprot:CAMPEP_0182922780 /NCGR_PEP_ID=MMETSP0105_2-20130417/5017_1 /TAXON_ID=81532 ORGANISM="Acanthoeca-like sp., Strain 10tr" /NCGR_SAMPLE_ID=MMETSP0105_2 /ASSEMBLY_ACC=CAM_ASM_000205 /LENGTH=135 /DNA_ID=CAMNT_0025060433 /DNA_START=140 /DNA_END=547 /DNA_ORIENTATION=+